MNLIDVISLAVALAMDCFAISMVSGVIMKRFDWRVIFRMSFLFGLFQALMPFFGWLGINYFSSYIEPVDHWIAFAMLAFIGGRMVKESSEHGEEPHFHPDKLRTQLVLAVATSIDALAVGISFACVGYRSLSDISGPMAVIGVALGIRFGNAVVRRLRAELFGGIILILIGVKILITHLFL